MNNIIKKYFFVVMVQAFTAPGMAQEVNLETSWLGRQVVQVRDALNQIEIFARLQAASVYEALTDILSMQQLAMIGLGTYLYNHNPQGLITISMYGYVHNIIAAEYLSILGLMLAYRNDFGGLACLEFCATWLVSLYGALQENLWIRYIPIGMLYCSPRWNEALKKVFGIDMMDIIRNPGVYVDRFINQPVNIRIPFLFQA